MVTEVSFPVRMSLYTDVRDSSSRSMTCGTVSRRVIRGVTSQTPLPEASVLVGYPLLAEGCGEDVWETRPNRFCAHVSVQ